MVVSAFARPLAVVLCLAATPVMAQSSFDPVTGVLRMIGISPPDRDPIEYRERAPLVVPPNTGRLRTPEEAAAERNPNWPQDPDVLARRRKAEEAKQPVARRDPRLDPNEGAGLAIDGSKVRNRFAGVPVGGVADKPVGSAERPVNLTTEQVRAALSALDSSGAPLKPGEEPKRQFLTEPPAGYRKGASGAPVKATIDPWKNPDHIEMNVLRQQRQ
jgi:hypothetical protein